VVACHDGAHSVLRDLPRKGSLRSPLIFLTVCLGANVLEFVVREAMRGFPIFAPFLKRGWGPVGLTFLFTPIAVTWLALPLVWAFFLSVSARYLDATGDLRPTLRIVCYASAPLVLELPLPGIGLFVWSYALYLAIRGLQQFERWSGGRALAAVAIALPAVVGVSLITVVPYLGSILFVSGWRVLLSGGGSPHSWAPSTTTSDTPPATGRHWTCGGRTGRGSDE